MKALENENRNDEQQDSDDKKIKFATGFAPNRFVKIDIFRALNSFRRQLKSPGQDQRNWKTNYEEQHHQAHSPTRDIEEWKNLARDLHQQPCDDRVGDRNLVDVASFQLGEEISRVHCHGLSPMRRSRSAKRGSSRRVS